MIAAAPVAQYCGMQGPGTLRRRQGELRHRYRVGDFDRALGNGLEPPADGLEYTGRWWESVIVGNKGIVQLVNHYSLHIHKCLK